MTEYGEFDLNFEPTEQTNYTEYLQHENQEEIFEFATYPLYRYDFFIDDDYDWESIETFLNELKQHNIVDDDNIMAIKENWCNALEIKEEHKRKQEEKQKHFNQLIQIIQLHLHFNSDDYAKQRYYQINNV